VLTQRSVDSVSGGSAGASSREFSESRGVRVGAAMRRAPVLDQAVVRNGGVLDTKGHADLTRDAFPTSTSSM
jgi:hypothetical protein